MKIKARVSVAPKIEVRTKKDGSGTYEYAEVRFQLYGIDGQPGIHETFDWRTGQTQGTRPDEVKMDGIREKAQSMVAECYQPGEEVVLNISVGVDRYGNNAVDVVSVERMTQQQYAQQQMQSGVQDYGHQGYIQTQAGFVPQPQYMQQPQQQQQQYGQAPY